MSSCAPATEKIGRCLLRLQVSRKLWAILGSVLLEVCSRLCFCDMIWKAEACMNNVHVTTSRLCGRGPMEPCCSQRLTSFCCRFAVVYKRGPCSQIYLLAGAESIPQGIGVHWPQHSDVNAQRMAHSKLRWGKARRWSAQLLHNRTTYSRSNLPGYVCLVALQPGAPDPQYTSSTHQRSFSGRHCSWLFGHRYQPK